MATGRKTVVVGQVIDPVAWGNPLWDQSVQTFASVADRTAQFPAPKQGAVTWIEDVKRLEVFDGNAWLVSPGQTLAATSAGAAVAPPEAAVLTLALTVGTWDVDAAGWVDWSTTGPPRYVLRIKDWTDAERDHVEVFIDRLNGSVPFTLMIPTLVVAAPNTIYLTASAAGGLSGPTAVRNLKLRARRVA